MKNTPLSQRRQRIDVSRTSPGLAAKIRKAEAIRDKQDEKKAKEKEKKDAMAKLNKLATSGYHQSASKKETPLKQTKNKESVPKSYEKPRPKKKVENKSEVKKPAPKPYRRTALEEKNLQDATQNKNMRPPFEQKRKK